MEWNGMEKIKRQRARPSQTVWEVKRISLYAPESSVPSFLPGLLGDLDYAKLFTFFRNIYIYTFTLEIWLLGITLLKRNSNLELLLLLLLLRSTLSRMGELLDWGFWGVSPGPRSRTLRHCRTAPWILVSNNTAI